MTSRINHTYLQGLDGEATEPMIKELEEEREESLDPEVEFAIAGAVKECGGLEIILGMIQVSFSLCCYHLFPGLEKKENKRKKCNFDSVHTWAVRLKFECINDLIT